MQQKDWIFLQGVLHGVMYHLVSRDRQIPNGFKFVQPETGFQPPRMVSFSTVVSAIVNHRLSNPALAAKHGWNTGYNEVAEEVDRFNANLCASMGWSKYIMTTTGDAPIPKAKAPSPSDQKQVAAAAGRVTKIWSGVKTLSDWIDSGAPAVPQSRADARAKVCATCPKNGKGDFTSWFTKPAAAAIAAQVDKLKDRKLATPYDEAINVCEACLCPLKLKVHTPFNFIREHMGDQVMRELKTAPACWIVDEFQATA
jgi:hypothetical protein